MKVFKKYKNSNFIKQRLFVTFFLALILTTMSVGYAVYHSELKLDGEVFIEASGYLMVSGARTMGMSNISGFSISHESIRNDDVVTLESDISITASSSATSSSDVSITYLYTIYNNSGYAYTYTGYDYAAEVSTGNVYIQSPVVSNIYVGDVLQPGDYAYVNVRYYLNSAVAYSKNIEVTNKFIFESGEPNIKPGSLQTAIEEDELVLDDNNMASTEVSILNLFNSGIEFSLESSNPLVSLTDSSGNTYKYGTILDVGDKAEYTLNFKVASYADFTQDIITTLYAVTPLGVTYDLGEIILYKEDVPTYRDAKVTYYITADATNPNHYNVEFTITNDGDEEMTEWTAYLDLGDELVITDFSNSNSNVIYDSTNHMIKISSLKRDGSGHNSLLPGASINISASKIGMNETTLLVNSVVVYRTGEEFTSGWEYTA